MSAAELARAAMAQARVEERAEEIQRQREQARMHREAGKIHDEVLEESEKELTESGWLALTRQEAQVLALTMAWVVAPTRAAGDVDEDMIMSYHEAAYGRPTEEQLEAYDRLMRRWEEKDRKRLEERCACGEMH